MKANGRVKKSDDLLFARFWRDQACFLLLGNHQSFDSGEVTDAAAKLNLATGSSIQGLSPPRTEHSARDRVKLARYGYSTTASVSGVVVFDANIMSDGTNFFVKRHADMFEHAVFEVDKKIDDPDTYRNWYQDYPHLLPDEPDFHLFSDHSSFVVIEMKNRVRINILNGLL